MQELSIEEKAKAYDEALKVAKGLYAKGAPDSLHLERIFPELKESKDEKIRKELIEYIKDQQSSFISAPDCRDKYEEEENNKYNSWLAWLEKQGENNMGISEVTKQELEDNINKALEKETPESCNKFLDEQAEQKPADKVEPKFKVGDYIISNNNSEIIYHITGTGINELGNPDYVCEHVGREKEYNNKIYNMRQDKVDANFKLWTIQDAKDGDVLASIDGDDILIFRNIEDNVSFLSYYNIARKGEHYWSKSRFIPATKEQRDLLFQKMKEAGYEWDAENKQLRKVEQKPADKAEPKS